MPTPRRQGGCLCGKRFGAGNAYSAMTSLIEQHKNLGNLLTSAAERHRDRIAFRTRAHGEYDAVTYESALAQARRLAAHLIGTGIRPGDRIVLLSENRPEWPIAYLGILLAGAAAVPLDAQLTETEVTNLVNHAEARGLVTSGTLLSSLAAPAREQIAPDRIVSLDPLPDGLSCHPALPALAEKGLPTDLSEPNPSPEDPAAIVYTSGTTGNPKGVVLSHQNLLSNLEAIHAFGLCGADDNFLALLPLHHTYPCMTTFLVPFSTGASVTFLSSLKGPRLVDCMNRTGVSVLVGVPQLLAQFCRGILDEIRRGPAIRRFAFFRLLALAGLLARLGIPRPGRWLFPQLHRRFGGRLRLLVSGGAKLAAEVATDLSRLGFDMVEGYGLTETSPVVTFNPARSINFDSVGLPIPGVEVQIRDPNPEGVGEICVRGENVTRGYYKNPDATAEILHDGWLHTGDLGYRDPDGNLYITGRAKEVIILASGKNVYPEEVETYFLQSPFIKEICVIGAEGQSRGEPEGLVALVLPDFDQMRARGVSGSQEAIRWEIERLGQQLPAYKRPTRLQIVREPFPRTRLGKIQRHHVLSTYQAEGLERRHVPAPTAPELEAGEPLLHHPLATCILEHLAEVSRGRGPVRLQDNLELDLGLDSLGRVELIVALEAMTGTSLPEELGAQIFTVRELIEAVLERAEEGATPAAEGRRVAWKQILARRPPEPVLRELVAGRSTVARLTTRLSLAILQVLFKACCRLRAIGLERIPRQGPCILAANHTSYVDAFALAASLPTKQVSRTYFLGFQQFFQSAVTAWLGRAYRVILVDADAYLAKSLQAAAHVLREGNSICVFPEGGRSIDGRVKSFKKGVGILAKELDVPLIPVFIKGSFEVWPRSQSLPRPHPMRITFGEPTTVAELLAGEPAGERDEYQIIADRLRDRVLALGENGD
ncbi:MAG: AMP-binding protein [Candidatus Methylomirabilales bacterium]